MFLRLCSDWRPFTCLISVYPHTTLRQTLSSSFYGWRGWGTERITSMGHVMPKLGFAPRPVQCQSCCSLHSRAVLISSLRFDLCPYKETLLMAKSSEELVLKTSVFWSRLARVLLFESGQVSFFFSGPSFSAYKIGNWTSQCLFLCRCGFCVVYVVDFCSKLHAQWPWEEVVVYFVPGGLGKVVGSKPDCWLRAL